jgi:7,8-dihydropterin-6-yl-methyl-4-(beta-D-ribofuranosyl)aminobenzene 5'-phosphate synthase
MSEYIALQPVDAAEVTILVDNGMDALLPSTQQVKRAPMGWDSFESPSLIAEHGYSLLLTVHKDGRKQSILYDTGLGKDTLVHNMDVLGIDPGELRAIVLSHGHADHHGGLKKLLERLGQRRIPLVLHPDVWRDRKVVFPQGGEMHLPPPRRADLMDQGVEVLERHDPSLLLDGMVLVTGQVPRTTEFEKGVTSHLARTNGNWEPDEWIWDDQAVVVNVQDKGLVVLSGCSHAGIVNLLRHARNLTGIEKVHSIIGGFHLSGAFFERIISPTVEALNTLRPDVIVPGHCTGWKAIHQIARLMPEAYVQSCVGTRVLF